jgi:hypothetical protein
MKVRDELNNVEANIGRGQLRLGFTLEVLFVTTI